MVELKTERVGSTPEAGCSGRFRPQPDRNIPNIHYAKYFKGAIVLGKESMSSGVAETWAEELQVGEVCREDVVSERREVSEAVG